MMVVLYLLVPAAIVSLAIIIAILHMIAPDHWTPIISYAIKNRYTKKKTGAVSLSLGILHGLFSSVLSFTIVIFGIHFIPDIYLRLFVVSILLFVSFYIIINARHEAHENRMPEPIKKTILLTSIIPDPAIVPVILMGLTYGMGFIFNTIYVFIIISGLTLFSITIFLHKILFNKINSLSPQKIDYLVALILLVTVVFVIL